MNSIFTFVLAFSLALLCGEFAYTLCFKATTFGGHLPFWYLFLAPLVGYGLGAVSRPT